MAGGPESGTVVWWVAAAWTREWAGDVAQHEGVRADERVVAYADGAEHAGADAEDDTVTDGGVPPGGPGIRPPADAAQGDAVVEHHVVAEHGGLADHHTHAVVDEAAAPDDGTGVDLDAGQGA